MIRLFCNSEPIRYSTYHLIKAFMPDEEIVQIKDLPPGHEKEAAGREFLVVMDGEGQIVSLSDIKLHREETDVHVYDTFRRICGRELPWGVLMGVRPVKLAMEQLGSLSEREFISRMRNEKRVSERKSALAWDIAGRERQIIRQTLNGRDKDPGTYSLYVGIPVCPSICSYCSFSSGPLSVWKDRMDDYVGALTGELSRVSARLQELTLTSVYIGGGTPTVLTPDQMKKLLACLDECYNAKGATEYTLEAGRPDTINVEKLELARAYGVNRISVNPQSMQQRTLDLVGRGHSVEQVEEAFELVKRLGFNNINMDVIAGLPGEDASDMQDTIARIAALEPRNLTVHALAVKRAAAMEKLKVEAAVVDEMLETASEGATMMGMKPYYMYRQKSIAGNHENTGYAVPGSECIYNVMIMEEVQSIFAFGAGATTKVLLRDKIQNPDRAEGVMTDLLRQDNPASISDYIRRFREMAEAKEKTFDID